MAEAAAVIKGSFEYVGCGIAAPRLFVLCPQCRGGRIHPSNSTCPRCGYKGIGHVYALVDEVPVVITPPR